MFNIDTEYFMKSNPDINKNNFLRVPQIDAYQAAYDHFINEKSKEHAKITLPTGTGKTGLMAILPYGISSGRVLIITPQIVIKDAVLGSLDPEYDKNFWIMTNIFQSRSDLPAVIEYETDHNEDLLQYANIVILNVHKLQKRLKSSLLKKVKKDFFDLIIIDEAHRSEAKTWQDAIEYFDQAKVIKVTGTPFRSDGKEIQGKDVYEYKLREAMSMGYVKVLEKITHIPEKMYLTVDENEDEQLTIEEIRERGIKDEDWINRSVALSAKSNEVIIDRSIELLEDKLRVSSFPHKIIAVACSIWHANQLKKMYEDKGYEVSIVHSALEKTVIKEELKRIEHHKVKVVINVAMLGEGYDHKFLSVAAIFRPYKNLLPYAQFIGRVLRSIDSTETENVVDEDNIAAVVYHKELGLEKLWQHYKEEISKVKLMPSKERIPGLDPKSPHAPKNVTYGEAMEQGEAKVEIDKFIDSEVLKMREERKLEDEDKINKMMELLGVDKEEAYKIFRQTQLSNDKQKLLRPDLYVERTRKRIDRRIKNEIVPDLLYKYNLELEGNDLKQNPFLFSQYRWILRSFSKNGEMLAILIENRLNDAIGGKRKTWTVGDWPKAEEELNSIVKYLEQSLNHYLRR